MWKLNITKMLALALMCFLGGSMYAQSIDATVIAPRSENGTFVIQFSEWNNDIVNDLYDLVVADEKAVESINIDEGNQMITVEFNYEDLGNAGVEVWFEDYLNEKKKARSYDATGDPTY
jgi:hypothetical protein